MFAKSEPVKNIPTGPIRRDIFIPNHFAVWSMLKRAFNMAFHCLIPFFAAISAAPSS